MTGAAVEAGGFHRSIVLAVGAAGARGVLHDDFHHFRVTVRHADGVVSAVAAETRRGPYSLCPRAGDELDKLVGQPLTPRIGEMLGAVSARLQCTHQLDLAALTIAAAARGAPRRYAVAVSAPVDDRCAGTVTRDGQAVLAWVTDGTKISQPAPFAGLELGAGFSAWTASQLDEDLAEAALVLRRGIVLSRSRRHLPRLDRLGHAPATGNCWVQQDGTAETATRLRGVVRDYSDGAVPFDQADRDWLAGA